MVLEVSSPLMRGHGKVALGLSQLTFEIGDIPFLLPEARNRVICLLQNFKKLLVAARSFLNLLLEVVHCCRASTVGGPCMARSLLSIYADWDRMNHPLAKSLIAGTMSHLRHSGACMTTPSLLCSTAMSGFYHFRAGKHS